MSSSSANNNNNDKEKLKILLNECLTIKNKIKTSIGFNKELAETLSKKCNESLKLAKQLSMEHGEALSKEMLCFAKWHLLLSKLQQQQQVDLLLIDEIASIESDLLQTEKTAVAFGDRQLQLRILELLTNIYSVSKQLDMEIETIDKVIRLSERTVPKVSALLDAYFRKLSFVYQDRDRIYQLDNPQGQQPLQGGEGEEQSANGFMKLNAEAWEQYLWLKGQSQFNRDAFIRAKKAQLFKLAIYIGSLANPLISGKDPKVLDISMEAFDEAFYIAELTKDNEYFCAASAHKSSVVYRTLAQPEREKLLQNLKDLQQQYQPKNDEIKDLIHSIEVRAPSLHPEDIDKKPDDDSNTTTTNSSN
eukprot:gene9896-12139_t